MEVKEILKNLRERHHLTQEEMAKRINITRQAVSRWETGETQPNTEMLKKYFLKNLTYQYLTRSSPYLILQMLRYALER